MPPITGLTDFAKRNDLISFLDRYCLRRQYFRTVENTFLELGRIKTFSENEKTELQNRRMKDILKYAYDNCLYYKQLFDEYGLDIDTLDNFSRLPFLTKDVIRKHGRDLISRAVNSIFLVKRNTGGSTGEPLEFYSDASACAIDLAHHKYLYHIIGYEPADIIASGSGIVVPARYRTKNIYWLRRSKHNIWWHICFSALYLNDDTIGIYVKELLKVKPSILRGYPSFWGAIARYILMKKIDIDFKVKGVNLTAEICSTEQRELIERAFNSKVFFEYGQTELTLFCYTDRTSFTYQASPVYGYIEVIKDDGTYADDGEEGEVVATSLCNRGMPFIRYRTGDRVIVRRRRGGMIWFDVFYGRTQDYVFDKKNRKIALTALIFGQNFAAFKNMIRWQLQQDEIGTIIIKIIRGPLYTIQDEKEITGKIKDSADIDVMFKYDDRMSLSKTGKFLFLIQNCRN